jgi:hypothetical protein
MPSSDAFPASTIGASFPHVGAACKDTQLAVPDIAKTLNVDVVGLKIQQTNLSTAKM